MRYNALCQGGALIAWQKLLIAVPGTTEILPFNNMWKVYCQTVHSQLYCGRCSL